MNNDPRYYLTQEEKQEARAELAKINAEAEAARKVHSTGLHPRVAAIRALIENKKQEL